jgi:HlyD family secretion protein
MRRLLIPLSLVTVALLAALGVKLYQQQREAEGPPWSSGVVEGTETDLTSRVGGRVERFLVDEGHLVEPGQILAELDCDLPRAVLAEAEARLAETEARASAQAAQAEGAGAERRAASVSARAAAERVDALAARRALAEREAERVARLGEYATASRRDQATTSAAHLAAELEAAEADVTSLRSRSQAVAAQAQAARSTATAAERAQAVAQAVVDRARLDVDECLVRASTGGVVEEVFLEVGEMLSPGRPVARVVALDEVEVIVYVPNDELALVEPGMTADVRADAFPDRPFRGQVVTVAPEAAFTPRNIQTRSDRDRLVFPVEVRLDNPEHALRPGMPVEVTLRPGTGARAARWGPTRSELRRRGTSPPSQAVGEVELAREAGR